MHITYEILGVPWDHTCWGRTISSRLSVLACLNASNPFSRAASKLSILSKMWNPWPHPFAPNFQWPLFMFRMKLFCAVFSDPCLSIWTLCIFCPLCSLFSSFMTLDIPYGSQVYIAISLCRDLFWAPKLNVSSFLSPYTALFYSCHLLLLDDIFSSYFPPKNIRSIFYHQVWDQSLLYIVCVQYMFIMWMVILGIWIERDYLAQGITSIEEEEKVENGWEYQILVLLPHN